MEQLLPRPRFADFIAPRSCVSAPGKFSLRYLPKARTLLFAKAERNRTLPFPVPRSRDEAHAALIAGWTIGVRHSERCHAELGALAQGFRETFRSDVDIQFYCTPGGQRGFGWHCDAEDVFVLQTFGQKTWGLRAK